MAGDLKFSVLTPVLVLPRYMRATGGSSRVMCDNVPGLVSRQRQLCHRNPDVMRAIGLGVAEWTAECQHQFRQHRWNCNTLDRDHSLFGRVLLRSKSPAFGQLFGLSPYTLLPFIFFLWSLCSVFLAFYTIKSLFCWEYCLFYGWGLKKSRNLSSVLQEASHRLECRLQAGVF